MMHLGQIAPRCDGVVLFPKIVNNGIRILLNSD